MTAEAWSNYLELGGSLDPDVDCQSPFWSREELEEALDAPVEDEQREDGGGTEHGSTVGPFLLGHHVADAVPRLGLVVALLDPPCENGCFISISRAV